MVEDDRRHGSSCFFFNHLLLKMRRSGHFVNATYKMVMCIMWGWCWFDLIVIFNTNFVNFEGETS